MNERGMGYLTDVLVFALLLSTASLFLLNAVPIDPRIQSVRYASSFAQSTLLALQHSTAGEFGGFEYRLSILGFELNLPVLGDSAKRNLRHKTLAQLLVEDALLNMCIELNGIELETSKPSQALNDKIHEFLKEVLDKLIGGRFLYRLKVKSAPVELDFARVHFESEIKNSGTMPRQMLCSETVVMALPVSKEELKRRIEEALGTSLEFEPNFVVEITLELWSL